MVGQLTLVGSGETAPGMVRIHRALLDDLGEAPRAVFLDTPAGFELGQDAIRARFHDYFERQLGVPLDFCHFTGRDASLQDQGAALQALAEANYILAGPGSPTYAARQLAGSSVFDAVKRRWGAGAHLVFASAAAIALGRCALPVYELYKVGLDLQWADGLDLLGPYGFQLAIVTHWNNAEGGTHDTRACFMGMERFGRLQALLPAEVVVLGIDEHTAVSFDLDHGRAEVRGKGGITILRDGAAERHPSQEIFPMEALLSTTPAPTGGAHPIPRAGKASFPAGLGPASASIGAGDLPGGLRLAAESAPAGLAALLYQAAAAAEKAEPSEDDLGELLEAFVDMRAALRERGEWALADGLRARLLAIGFALRDTPEGTVWDRTG